MYSDGISTDTVATGAEAPWTTVAAWAAGTAAAAAAATGGLKHDPIAQSRRVSCGNIRYAYALDHVMATMMAWRWRPRSGADVYRSPTHTVK